jgi:hypothetical protein
VHRETTQDGKDLAIKDQYPGARKNISSDVNKVALLLRVSGLLPKTIDISPLLLETKRQRLRERKLWTGVSGTVAHQGAALQGGMFGAAAGHALAPHPEGSWLHLAAHQGDHAGLVQAKLQFNGLERSAVLPSHLNDARKIGWGLWCKHGGHGLERGCAKFNNDHEEFRRSHNFGVSTGHCQSLCQASGVERCPTRSWNQRGIPSHRENANQPGL